MWYSTSLPAHCQETELVSHAQDHGFNLQNKTLKNSCYLKRWAHILNSLTNLSVLRMKEMGGGQILGAWV